MSLSLSIDTRRWYEHRKIVNPSAVLSFENSEGMEPIPEDEIQRIRAEFEEFNSPENQGSLMVLTPGAKLEPWGGLSKGCLSNSTTNWEVKMYLMLAPQAERNFIYQMVKSPKDPVVHLVYADWLEEQGRQLEAESERELAKVLSEFNVNDTRA